MLRLERNTWPTVKRLGQATDRPPKIVKRRRNARIVSHGSCETHDRCREHCRQPTRREHICFVGTRYWPQISAALANGGVKTTISSFPALTAKRENFPLGVDHDLYFLDAGLPNLPSEHANVGERSSVMLGHRRLGHIISQSVKKLAQKKGATYSEFGTTFSQSVSTNEEDLLKRNV